MILLNSDEIISLHRKLIQKTGGSDGVRDIGLLESAVFSVNSAFDNVEKYPAIEEKAARLAYALISNHAFVDGNKRIGVTAMLLTLKLNNINLCYTQKELITLGLGVADGSIGYDAILDFVNDHKI